MCSNLAHVAVRFVSNAQFPLYPFYYVSVQVLFLKSHHFRNLKSSSHTFTEISTCSVSNAGIYHGFVRSCHTASESDSFAL